VTIGVCVVVLAVRRAHDLRKCPPTGCSLVVETVRQSLPRRSR